MPEWVEIKALALLIGWPGALLTAIGVANYKGMWKWGQDYRDMTADRDYWRARALEFMARAEVQGAALRETKSKVVGS